MTDHPVRKDYAMTGEVTLTGRVLPVGGVREKALAALNNKIFNIILPIANEKDVEEIPEQFRKKINFSFVENLDEVLAIIFDKKLSTKKPTQKSQKKTKLPAAAAAA